MAVTLPFGGTLGLTIMTTVFNNESGIGSDSPVRNFDVLHSLPEAQRSIVTQQAKVRKHFRCPSLCKGYRADNMFTQ